MGIQQIPDQIKKAPTLGLRAVFSGIGRILMSADRPQATAAAGTQAASAPDRRQQATRRSRSAGPPEPASRWRSLDQTGNVRLLTDEDLDDEPDVRPAAVPGSTAGTAPGPGGPGAAAGHGATSYSAVAALPLPGYDTLPLASIRARLRGLDVAQLKVLLEYESRNAERPEVLGMFERRIEKLETGS
jgi:hypothetical protein